MSHGQAKTKTTGKEDPETVQYPGISAEERKQLQTLDQYQQKLQDDYVKYNERINDYGNEEEFLRKNPNKGQKYIDALHLVKAVLDSADDLSEAFEDFVIEGIENTLWMQLLFMDSFEVEDAKR